MVNSFATNISHIGTKETGAVRSAGNRISKGAEIAVNFVLASAGIKVEADDAPWEEHVMARMTVVAACGRTVGFVDEVAGGCIKLTVAQGEHRQPKLIPWDWIERVDSRVFLNRDYEEVTRGT